MLLRLTFAIYLTFCLSLACAWDHPEEQSSTTYYGYLLSEGE